MDCPICLTVLNPDETMTLPKIDDNCGHSICKHCVQELMDNMTSLDLLCPICRSKHNMSNKLSFYRCMQLGIKSVADAVVNIEPINIVINTNQWIVAVPIIGITTFAFFHKYPITLSNYVVGITTGLILISPEKFEVSINVSNAVDTIYEVTCIVALVHSTIINLTHCK